MTRAGNREPSELFAESGGAFPHPLPDVLERHLTESGLHCEFGGLRMRLYKELTPPALLEAGYMRLFHVGVSVGGIGESADERDRLLYVGEGESAEGTRKLALALEMADVDAISQVLPQLVDHFRVEGASLLLTSDHLHRCQAIRSKSAWWSVGLAAATEMLILVTSALRWFHEQGLTLGGLRLEQLMINPRERVAALAHLGQMVPMDRMNEVAAVEARQRDIASIGRLLLEAATGKDAAESRPIFDKVLDDAQVLVDAGLARPGLSQLLVGSLIQEAPFGYTTAEDLLHGLMQLKVELKPSLTFNTAMLSTVGNFPLRRTDQDSCGYSETRVVYHGTTRHVGFYCVADGVGGEEHGERASQASVFAAMQAFHRAVNHYPYDDLRANASNIARAIVKISAQHLAIMGEAEPDRNRGATTFTGAIVAGDRVGLGHVGDSRAYLLREGVLTQLTRDHNLANVKIALKEMTGKEPQEAHGDERRISRYLGTSNETPMSWVDAYDPVHVPLLVQNDQESLAEEEVEGYEDPMDAGIESDLLSDSQIVIGSPTGEQSGVLRLDKEVEALSATLKVKPGDRLIIMSDGLYGELDDDTMCRIIQTSPTNDHAARALLSAAMRDLSMDNISILLIEVGLSESNLSAAP